MTVRPLPVLALLGALAVTAACGSPLPPPQYVAESPLGSGTWVEIAAAPGWTSSAPGRRAGTLRFVTSRKSNLRSIATHRARDHAIRTIQERVRSALGGIGQDVADGAAGRVDASLVLVEQVCKQEVLTERMVPGNTLCTAWALWEVSLDGLLEGVPAESRDAARTALDQDVR